MLVKTELKNFNQPSTISIDSMLPTTTFEPLETSHEKQSSVRALKSILSNNEDFDAESSDEQMANNNQQQQSDYRVQQPRSLYEELIASEKLTNSANSNFVTKVKTVDVIPSSSKINSLNQFQQSSSVEDSNSIKNDNNNNHMLNKKQKNSQLTIVNSTPAQIDPATNHISRSNSGEDSRSESFEIDW